MTGEPSAYKFRLTELISRYPAKQRLRLKQQLCRELGIGLSTWHLWANYRRTAKQDIPFHSAYYLAERFGLEKVSDLSNAYEPAEKVQPENIEEETETSAAA